MNPEQHVIDEIDQLVSETMAAGVDRLGRPLDDYTRDRYDRCQNCDHSWHGLACGWCECPSSTAECQWLCDDLEFEGECRHLRVEWGGRCIDCGVSIARQRRDINFAVETWPTDSGQPVEAFVQRYGLQRGQVYIDYVDHVELVPAERHRQMMQGMLDDMRALGILDE